jgi:hypothetical protein
MELHCTAKGCGAIARLVPQINVPSVGSALLNLPVCPDCYRRMDPQQFLTPTIKAVFATIAHGKPTFSAAYLTGVALTSEEYRRRG